MRIPQSGLRIDSAAWPLLRSQVSYWGITSGPGNALGTTFVCADLDNWPTYVPLSVKMLTGPSAGQVRAMQVHAAGGIITVANPFTNAAGAVQQLVAGTLFCILSAGGGGGAGPLAPSIGLWMFGEVSPAAPGSVTIHPIPNLAGFPDDIFNNEFWMQVIHNFDAAGTAPEREWRRITDYVGATGTFTTDAFSANVEANDLVAIVHESIMGIEIIGFGTLDTDSTTVPADSTRAAAYAWENNDYFKGCILMPTEGDCRFQPRPIATFTVAGGIFGLDEPFSQLPGAVDYVIIRSDYPYQRLIDIFNIVNAILMTTETGGTILTTGPGTEDNVYINNAPAGVYEPLKVMIDFSVFVRDALNHGSQATETIVIRVYYRIYPGGSLIKKDEVTFVGVLDPALINVELEPCRYGIAVTMERTGGNARYYDFAVFYRG